MKETEAEFNVRSAEAAGSEYAAMSTSEIEEMIQSKNLNAPRITTKDLDDAMMQADLSYFHFPGTTVIICCAKLANGFCLVGKAAAVSPENFDENIGREVAYKDAREQLWPLLGYNLKCDLQQYPQ